jgi:hypothetical protein
VFIAFFFSSGRVFRTVVRTIPLAVKSLTCTPDPKKKSEARAWEV